MTLTPPRQILFWSLSGLLFVWGWFRPIFWNLTEIRDSYWAGFLDIFIYPSTPEYMLGAGIDQMGTFWIFSSLPTIISNNGYLDGIFHPIGWDIGWNTGFAWVDGILSIPLQILGTPTFYNAHIAVTLWTSFLGICWLIGKVTRCTSWLLTLLIPIIAVLALNTPFAFEEIAMGRPTQMYWWPLCLYLGLIYDWKDTESIQWTRTIAVGISFALSCLVYWFGAVSIGMCVGLAMVLQTATKKHKRKHIQRCLVAGSISIAFISLCTYRMLADLLTGANSFDQLNKLPVSTLNIGPISLPIFDKTHILNSSEWLPLIIDHPSTIPILALGLFGALYPKEWRKRIPWIIAWVVSLGIPVTGAIVQSNITIPTGQSLLQWIFPLLLRCENPDRMMVATTLLSVVLGGMALQSILVSSKVSRWIPCTGIVIFGIGMTWPEHNDLRVSSFVVDEFRITTANSYPGGMIDVPLSRSENTYVQQLFHKQPLLGGPGLNRVQPPKHQIYCDENALLKGLIELEQIGQTSITFSNLDIQQLIDDGFTTIIFDPQGGHVSQSKLEEFINNTSIIKEERTGQSVYLLQDLIKDTQ